MNFDSLFSLGMADDLGSKSQFSSCIAKGDQKTVITNFLEQSSLDNSILAAALFFVTKTDIFWLFARRGQEMTLHLSSLLRRGNRDKLMSIKRSVKTRKFPQN